jgi:hypothetical protein
VIVSDKVTGIVHFRKFKRWFDSAQVIADVQIASRLYSSKRDSFHKSNVLVLGGNVKRRGNFKFQKNITTNHTNGHEQLRVSKKARTDKMKRMEGRKT